ncbi:S-protein homolog 5-like [Neltuma alba]|uniref:S-protein homolog 5-like n=1 Tax=Neltuma alba TaxID=207710 RepID=UPI0010A30A3C|nr:S-protein homolog 5-like [Prosopis alba]
MVKQHCSSAASLSLLLLMASSSLITIFGESLEEDAEGPATSSENISLLPKRHVRITNDLGKGRVLRIHCKSKDDDLGVHYLSFHSTYQWKFKTNALIRNTLFYCYMWWGNNVTGSYDVYRATRDDDKCTDCKWSIRTDGWYWFDSGSGHWHLMYQWPKP